MFELELSHTFSVVEWSCPVTRTVDLAFVERAIRRGSRTEFMCSIPGCHLTAPAIAMLNIDRSETGGVVVILCHRHAGQMESDGHRCFWLDLTLKHAVSGYESKVDEAVQQAILHAARSRACTQFGWTLRAACRQQLHRRVA